MYLLTTVIIHIFSLDYADDDIVYSTNITNRVFSISQIDNTLHLKLSSNRTGVRSSGPRQLDSFQT